MEWDYSFLKLFLIELFDRNVRWIYKKYPELKTLEKDDPSQRIEKTWDANLTSLRLVMFQVYFIKNLGHPEGKSHDDILLYYNRSFGQPNKIMIDQLLKTAKDILSINSFKEFFNFLGIEISNEKLYSLLKNAQVRSAKKGYNS